MRLVIAIASWAVVAASAAAGESESPSRAMLIKLPSIAADRAAVWTLSRFNAEELSIDEACAARSSVTVQTRFLSATSWHRRLKLTTPESAAMPTPCARSNNTGSRVS